MPTSTIVNIFTTAAVSRTQQLNQSNSSSNAVTTKPTLESVLNDIKSYLKEKKAYTPLQVKSVEMTDELPLLPTIKAINHLIKLLKSTDKEMYFNNILKNLLQNEFPIACSFQTNFTKKGDQTTQILRWNPGYLVAAMLSFQPNTFEQFLELQNKLSIPKSDQYIFFTDRSFPECYIPSLAQLLIKVFALNPTEKKFRAMLPLLNHDEILAKNFIKTETLFKPTTFDIINTATILPKQKLLLIKQLLSKLDKGNLPNIIAKKIISQLMSRKYCKDIEFRDVLILNIIELSDSPYMLLSITLNLDPQSSTSFMSETSSIFLKTFTKWLNENPKKMSLPEIKILLYKSKALCESIIEMNRNHKKIERKSKSKSKTKPKPSDNKLNEESPLKYLFELAAIILMHHNRDIDLDSTTEETPKEAPNKEVIYQKIFELLKNPTKLTFANISTENQEKIHQALAKINIQKKSLISDKIIQNMILYGSSTTLKTDTDLDIMLPPNFFTYLLKNFSEKSQNNVIHVLNVSSVKNQVKSFSVAVRLSEEHVQLFDFCIKPNKPSEQIPPISDISQESNALPIQHDIWKDDPKNLMRLLKIYRDTFLSVKTTEEDEIIQCELENSIKHNILLNELNNTYIPEHYVTKIMVSTDCSSSTQFNDFKVALLSLFDSQRKRIQKPPLTTEIELQIFEDLVFNKETTPPSPEHLHNLLQIVSNPTILSIIMHRLFPTTE